MFIISYNYVNIQTKCYNASGAILHPNKLGCFPHAFNELDNLRKQKDNLNTNSSSGDFVVLVDDALPF